MPDDLDTDLPVLDGPLSDLTVPDDAAAAYLARVDEPGASISGYNPQRID